MITPAIQYQAALRTLAVASGPFRPRITPLPPNYPGVIGKVGAATGAYAFDQEFEILMSSFPPAQKNTPANAAGPVFAGLLDGNAILTKFSQPTPTGGGRGKFTGSFARVPASWDDFQTETVTFPGWQNYNGISFEVSGSIRPQKTSSVNVRVRHDYFVVDPTGILSGAGVIDSSGAAINTVAAKGAIPALLRQQFFANYQIVIGGEYYPVPNSDCKDLAPVGGLNTGSASSGFTFIPETMPSVQAYQVWAANAVAFVAGGANWDSTHPPIWDGSTSDGTAGQYRHKDSILAEYEGNIIDRQSFCVLAR